ncbi:hypothetical protein C8J56DRAFT_905382 [Mycena floridula]|nr:hypothetical protein C8J56DRAFT_905382 [Mycena floridula]
MLRDIPWHYSIQSIPFFAIFGALCKKSKQTAFWQDINSCFASSHHLKPRPSLQLLLNAKERKEAHNQASIRYYARNHQRIRAELQAKRLKEKLKREKEERRRRAKQAKKQSRSRENVPEALVDVKKPSKIDQWMRLAAALPRQIHHVMEPDPDRHMQLLLDDLSKPKNDILCVERTLKRLGDLRKKADSFWSPIVELEGTVTSPAFKRYMGFQGQVVKAISWVENLYLASMEGKDMQKMQARGKFLYQEEKGMLTQVKKLLNKVSRAHCRRGQFGSAAFVKQGRPVFCLNDAMPQRLPRRLIRPFQPQFIYTNDPSPWTGPLVYLDHSPSFVALDCDYEDTICGFYALTYIQGILAGLYQQTMDAIYKDFLSRYPQYRLDPLFGIDIMLVPKEMMVRRGQHIDFLANYFWCYCNQAEPGFRTAGLIRFMHQWHLDYPGQADISPKEEEAWRLSRRLHLWDLDCPGPLDSWIDGEAGISPHEEEAWNEAHGNGDQ